MDINEIITLISGIVLFGFLIPGDKAIGLLQSLVAIVFFICGAGFAWFAYIGAFMLIFLLPLFLLAIIKYDKRCKYGLLSLWILSAFLASHFGFGWISI